MAQLVKNLSCQCRRRKRWGFNPWVRKIPWIRKWWPTPVLLPGKSHGQRILEDYSQGVAKSWMWLSTHTHIQGNRTFPNCTQKNCVLKSGFEPLFFICPPQTASFPTRCCVLISCSLRSLFLPWSAILSPDFSLFQWQLSFQMSPGTHILWEISPGFFSLNVFTFFSLPWHLGWSHCGGLIASMAQLFMPPSFMFLKVKLWTTFHWVYFPILWIWVSFVTFSGQ